MSDTIATKAAAEHVGTTPRQLRQFLRASKDYEAVGSGGRYAFESDDLPELKTRFQVWLVEREAAAKARAEKEAAEKAAAQDESQPDDKNGDIPAEGNDAEAMSDHPKPARGRKPAAA